MKNMEKNNLSKKQKAINLLKKKIDFLRVIVYIILFFLGLITILYVSTISQPLNRSSIDVFHTNTPKELRASLYISPETIKCNVGDEFGVDVLINTMGSKVVAVGAYLDYNEEVLELIKVDRNNSDFSIKVKEETIKEEGELKLSFAQPKPGVDAYNGQVVRVIFKAIAPTSPRMMENIDFDFIKDSKSYSSAILMGDEGRNILSKTRGCRVYINEE